MLGQIHTVSCLSCILLLLYVVYIICTFIISSTSLSVTVCMGGQLSMPCIHCTTDHTRPFEVCIDVCSKRLPYIHVHITAVIRLTSCRATIHSSASSPFFAVSFSVVLRACRLNDSGPKGRESTVCVMYVIHRSNIKVCSYFTYHLLTQSHH